MKKRNIVIVLLLLVIVFFVLKYQFESKYDIAKADSERQTENSKNDFLDYKHLLEDILDSLGSDYKQEFNNTYSISEGKKRSNKIIKLLVFSREVEEVEYEKVYLSCLYGKVVTLISKNKALKQFQSKLGADYFSIENDIVGKSERYRLSFIKKTELQFENKVNCMYYHYYNFSDQKLVQYKYFLKELQEAFRTINEENQIQIKALKQALNVDNYTFYNNGLRLFNQKIRSKNYMIMDNLKIEVKTEALGTVSIDINTVKFNRYSFDYDLNEVFTEQYKTNSLYTGAQPYKEAYGSNKSCNDYGCSEISVKGPNNSEVLVLIKKNGRVVRHAYIHNGERVTVSMPNGYYQVFFYYGKGWNPNKKMKYISGYGNLKGGFVREEHFDKDDQQYLNNQKLTYELILQQNGNLQTKSSSMSEAM